MLVSATTCMSALVMSRLAAIVEKSPNLRGFHLPPTRSASAEVAALRTVQGRGRRNLHQQCSRLQHLRYRYPVQRKVQWWRDAVGADLGHHARDSVQLAWREGLRGPVVGDAEDEPSPARIGESCDSVGEVATLRGVDIPSSEPDLLHFEVGVRAQSDLRPECLVIDRHAFPLRARCARRPGTRLKALARARQCNTFTILEHPAQGPHGPRTPA